MAAPPSPPYPKTFAGLPGKSQPLPCGSKWYLTETVTGQIPGKGTAGKQFKKALQPLASIAELQSTAADPAAQQDLQAIIEAKIDALREQVSENSGAGGKRRFLTVKEEGSVLWLLDHADAELGAANKRWDKVSAEWENRKDGAWPLNYGDTLRDFHIACEFKKPGETVTIQGDGRKVVIKCPSLEEMLSRPKDRAKVVQRFEWALMSTRCAEWGLNRILLYKEALADWHNVDFPKVTDPGAPPPSPSEGDHPSDFKAPQLPDDDLCKLLGIGCPPGFEPPSPEGNAVPLCPSDFCIDPGELPDPEDVGPEGDEAPTPTKPATKPKTYSASTVVAVGVVGAAAVYGLVTLLRPR